MLSASNELVNGRPLGLAEAIGHVSVPVERPVRFGGGGWTRGAPDTP